MQPKFTPSDIEEARRLNKKLNLLPRFKMETALGRTVLNLLLRVAEIYPLIRSSLAGVPREVRTVEALGRRVRVRIFRPPDVCKGVVLDFHGGGWTIGNARMSDDQNAELAARIGVAVVSVDYRLATSVPLRDIIDDCETAALWTLDHATSDFGVTSIVLKGASAGAHIAALTLLRLRDRHGAANRIAGAMLYFGLYDFAGTPMVRAAGPKTLILDAPTVRSQLRALTPSMSDEERRAPALSPLYADLGSLPPAVFIVGAEDMLLEDNEKMEKRWRAANHNSELLVVPESPHAFNRMKTAIAKKVEGFADGWLLERMR